jgi:preprotein translocase subunit SecD
VPHRGVRGLRPVLALIAVLLAGCAGSVSGVAAPAAQPTGRVVTVVANPVGAATVSMLTDSVQVVQRRLSDVPGVVVTAGPSSLTVVGPVAAKDRLVGALRYRGQLTVREVRAQNVAATAASGEPLAAQPTGGDPAGWTSWTTDASALVGAGGFACTKPDTPLAATEDTAKPLLTCDDANVMGYLLDVPLIRGADIAKAVSVPGDNAGASIMLTLTSAGSGVFGAYTAGHVGTAVAFTLDGLVVTAPIIQAPISGVVQISGSFSVATAAAVAAAIDGQLPAAFEVVSVS